MSNKKNTKRANQIEDKKAAVLGSGKKKQNVLLLGILCGMAVILSAGWFFLARNPAQSPSIAASNLQGDTVILPVALFEDGRARHFEYHYGDITLRYFVIKSSDGVIRAAFDACDVCWPAGKGYSQDGDAMVCRNCGRRFASVLVNEVQGGCNPAPLNRTVVDDRLFIRVKDIQDGKMYFDFAGKV
jgi:uncharacterized membrane protein